mgnify:CR=1 FL=1
MNEAGQRVLVVDDENSIRRYLRAALSAQGFDIYEAANGQEAINAVVSHHPDIIILDLGLPDFDGIEVTRRLREWSQTPIIILSVREAENDKIAALGEIAQQHMAGWPTATRPDPQALAAQKQRAMALGASA